MSHHDAGCQPIPLQQRRCGGAHSINVLPSREASQLWHPPPNKGAIRVDLAGDLDGRDFVARSLKAGANTRVVLRAIEMKKWIVDSGQRRHVLRAVAPVEARIQGEEAYCNFFSTGSHLTCNVKLSHDGVDETKARESHQELGHADDVVDGLTRSIKVSYDG